MYIICPNCQTNFIIDASMLMPNGRKVKCSKCRHIWYKEAPDISTIIATQQQNIIKRPVEVYYNLPVIVSEYDYPRLLRISLPVLFIILNFFLLLCIHNLKNANKELINGLQIEIVDLEKKHDNESLIVKYKISNLNNFAKQIPPIKLLFLDDKENIVYFYVQKETVVLEPHKYIYINSEFTDLSKKVENFDIKF